MLQIQVYILFRGVSIYVANQCNALFLRRAVLKRIVPTRHMQLGKLAAFKETVHQ